MVRTFVRHDDFVKHFPALAATIVATNPAGPFVPTTGKAIKYGPMVRLGQQVACRFHRSEMVSATARLPSWVLVEIDEGPGADRPTIQVA